MTTFYTSFLCMVGICCLICLPPHMNARAQWSMRTPIGFASVVSLMGLTLYFVSARDGCVVFGVGLGAACLWILCHGYRFRPFVQCGVFAICMSALNTFVHRWYPFSSWHGLPTDVLIGVLLFMLVQVFVSTNTRKLAVISFAALYQWAKLAHSPNIVSGFHLKVSDLYVQSVNQYWTALALLAATEWILAVRAQTVSGQENTI